MIEPGAERLRSRGRPDHAWRSIILTDARIPSIASVPAAVLLARFDHAIEFVELALQFVGQAFRRLERFGMLHALAHALLQRVIGQQFRQISHGNASIRPPRISSIERNSDLNVASGRF
jgi:hypothetical protein